MVVSNDLLFLYNIFYLIQSRIDSIVSHHLSLRQHRYCDDCDKSVVKAQLYPDPATLIFTSMDLTCPDNSTIFNVTIDDPTSNVQEIKEKLSTYCREECDSIYIN